MLNLDRLTRNLSLKSLVLLLLFDLEQESTIDMWQDTSKGDGGADQSVEFFIATDSELEVARGNALDFEILGGVSCQLENFSSEILEDGCDVDSGLGTNAHLVLSVVLQETLDTTARELETSLAGVALLLLTSIGADLASGRLSARGFSFASSHFCGCS